MVTGRGKKFERLLAQIEVQHMIEVFFVILSICLGKSFGAGLSEGEGAGVNFSEEGSGRWSYLFKLSALPVVFDDDEGLHLTNIFLSNEILINRIVNYYRSMLALPFIWT